MSRKGKLILRCPVKSCSCEGVVKSGLDSKGHQRYKCKSCNKRFILDNDKVTNRLTDKDKELIVSLVAEGVGFHAIARILDKCSWQAIWAWFKKSSNYQTETLSIV